THESTVPMLRSGEPAGARSRAMSARLSARNASAVVGAIGMKLGEGTRKRDQPAAHPMRTTLLCAATTAAARTAARMGSRSARAVLMYPRLKSERGIARARVTTCCMPADPYEGVLPHVLAFRAVIPSIGTQQPCCRSPQLLCQDLVQRPPGRRIEHRGDDFHPAPEIARPPICRPDVVLLGIPPPIGEVIDPGVLEKTTEDAHYPNPLGQSRHTRSQRTDPAHHEID